MPSIDLYYMPLSAPCRSIMMLAKALDVHLNLKLTDLMKGEHMRPEYLKMNPQVYCFKLFISYAVSHLCRYRQLWTHPLPNFTVLTSMSSVFLFNLDPIY